ncbi:MAG: PQQ-binding-like beta-propeller repeat protein [Rhizomicrobium sp.]
MGISCGPLAAPGESASTSAAYQINAAHDGNVTIKGFAPPLTLAWSRNLGDYYMSYPLITDDMVFVTAVNSAGGDDLFALDLKTGNTVWQQYIPFSGEIAWAESATDKNVIFVLSYYGMLQAFSAGNGQVLWQTQLQGQSSFTSPPTASGGQVFAVGSGLDGTLYAVNESKGTVEWTANVLNGDNSSPAVADGGVYVTYPWQAYKFKPSNGKLLWNYNGGGSGGGGRTPAVFDSRVFDRDPIGGNLVMTTSNGKVKGSFGATPIPAFWKKAGSDSIQIALNDGQLTATDVETGNILWSFAGEAP